MESLQRPDELAFVSPPLCVADFVAEAKAAYDALAEANFAAGALAPPPAACTAASASGGRPGDRKRWRLARSATTRARLGLAGRDNDNFYMQLRKRCHGSQLRDGTELSDDLFVDGLIPRQHKLESLRLLDAESDKRRHSSVYAQAVTHRLRTRKVNYKILDDGRRSALESWSSSGCSQFYPSDVLLTVHMCKPYNRPLTHAEIRLGRILKEETAFDVLGSTTIMELADAIACLSDYAVDTDQSAHSMFLDQDYAVFAKEKFKSRFFFLGNTFYCDFGADAIDLSDEFRKWAASRRNSEFGRFQVADMAQTRFVDLQHIRLGQPYVYVHQAFCEHLLVISQLRLLGPDDHATAGSYPRQVTFASRRGAACCACSLVTARWTVHGNGRLPFDPAFFCDCCYRKFNFDEHGHKVGEFTAVPYIDKTALLK